MRTVQPRRTGTSARQAQPVQIEKHKAGESHTRTNTSEQAAASLLVTGVKRQRQIAPEIEQPTRQTWQSSVETPFDENPALVTHKNRKRDAEDQESQKMALAAQDRKQRSKTNSATKPTATTTSGGRKNPHSKRYEHKVRKSASAKTDKITKQSQINKIHKDKKTHKEAKNQYNRPGSLETRTQAYGSIKDSVAYRYTFQKRAAQIKQYS
ncbi:MAG: hypothetical protein U0787_21915 [Polyangia bacterium]